MRAPEGTTLTTIRRGNRIITAAYGGGAYIDLTFGSEGYNPIEVINVWDYESNQPEPPFDEWGSMTNMRAKRELRNVVLTWMETQDEEWPEWYESYLENARQ